MDGIAPMELFWVPTAVGGSVPWPILAALGIGDAVRIRAVSVEPDGSPRDLPALVAVFRPPTVFGGPAWRHAVDPAAAAAIRARLDDAPAPAFLVSAGPEVVAWWPLATPLPVDRDPAEAVQRLVDLAARLGADVETARDLRATIPVAGPIRNWNRTSPDWVHVDALNPARRATLAELAAGRSGSRRKGVPHA
jgi:hypothetical protein